MLKKDLNTKQVGNLFGVDESTVRRWALSGKIKCISSAGGHRKFSYNDIVEFANKKGIELNISEEQKDFKPSTQSYQKSLNILLNKIINRLRLR